MPSRIGSYGSTPDPAIDAPAARRFDIPIITTVDISTVVTLPEKRPRSGEDSDFSAVLTPAVFHILLALADGKSHGYGIMQEVAQLTRGETRLGPGTLYRSIQRMLVDGLIEELAIALHDERDDDRRRYYRLTPKGMAVARREAQRLADLVDAARHRRLLEKRPGKRRS
jgi:DNA-binding PadR family transcriptional regulator